jgi:hypothetical protein
VEPFFDLTAPDGWVRRRLDLAPVRGLHAAFNRK